MQETLNIKSTLWSPEFIVDKRINKGTVTYSEISKEASQAAESPMPLPGHPAASPLPSKTYQAESSPAENKSFNLPEDDSGSGSPNTPHSASSSPPRTLAKSLEQLVLSFITVSAGENQFKGVLACVLDDFIILINGCTIYEIIIDEIEAVMFKAKGCPGKNPDRTLSVVEKAGQEPVPENNETSPRDLPVEEPAVTPPRVRTKGTKKFKKK